MDKVKILVACHKPAEVYRDNVYTPIHVGRAVSKCTDKMQDMIGDDTGDNISAKNPFYSELTAQYWLWKNVHDVEYVGLCHYRRYFKHLITEENVDGLLGNKNQIYLMKPTMIPYSIADHLMIWNSREDFYIFLCCFKKVHPESYHQLLVFLNRNKFSAANMFVVKKNLFDEFAKWQFPILFEMEKYVKLAPYSRQRRIYGYFAEILFSFYAEINHLKVKYDHSSDWPGRPAWQDFNLKTFYNTSRQALAFFITHIRKKEYTFDSDSVRIGLKKDGINLE